MANLFFVHTPLCLFVAQNIIIQENCTHNILFIRNVEDSEGFSEAYNMLLIDSLWENHYAVTDSRKWKKSTIRTLLTFIKNERYIQKIIKTHNIEKIYFANINDLRYRLEFLRIARMGIESCVYEEGLSHYIRQIYINYKKVIIGSLFLDFFILFPRLSLSYLKYLRQPEMTLLNDVIKKRFNILPQKEVMQFDEPLRITKGISFKLHNNVDELKQQLTKQNGSVSNLVLYASQPLFNRGFICDKVLYDVIDNLLESLKNNFVKKTVVIKFHPRETIEEQKIIKDLFQKHNINYLILETHRSIPLEVYLQNIPFDLLISFNSSCVAYDGYVYQYREKNLFIKDYMDALLALPELDNKYLIEVSGIVDYLEYLKQFKPPYLI